jgi:hypothetical protein
LAFSARATVESGNPSNEVEICPPFDVVALRSVDELIETLVKV